MPAETVPAALQWRTLELARDLLKLTLPNLSPEAGELCRDRLDHLTHEAALCHVEHQLLSHAAWEAYREEKHREEKNP